MGRSNVRKGLSTVVAATFFVTLAMLSLNILVWQMALYDGELEAARGKDDNYAARLGESIQLTATVSNSKLNATIQNKGNDLVHIVGVWITEYQTPTIASWHRRFVLNQRINPGRTVTNVGQELSQTLTSSYTYVVKFLTSRGNVMIGIFSPVGSLGKAGVSTTGYLFFTFSPDTFEMTNQTQSSPVAAWLISPGSQQIVWWVKVTNHGIYNLKLYKYSVLSFVRVEKAASVTQTQYYIVAPTSTHPGNISAYVDLSQEIPANVNGDFGLGGTPTWVKFSASKVDPNESQLTLNWNPRTQSEYMLFMIFYYRYGCCEELTQIIPIAGIHVR